VISLHLRAPCAAAVLSTALALAAAWPTAGSPAEPSRSLPLTPCQLAHPVLAERVSARCGTLEVPEDHAQPAGRKLTLRVAVVPSDAPGKAPDPIFFLAGGPGQAATQVYPAVAMALARAQRQRDVVLVDQRGTGGSAPLECEGLTDPAGAERTEAAELAAVRACGARLSARTDLSRYGSEDAARDLDLVRAALGAERIDLVGVSYGTRLALVYARAFPKRVRALVLDGVAPFEMPVGGFFERDAQAALELDFARCRADQGCARAFPDPMADLQAVLTGLRGAPRQLTLRDPFTGVARSQAVDEGQLRRLVFLLSYAPETAALLPALLAEARRGDLGPLAALGLTAGREVAESIGQAMQLAVLCAEDAPWFPPDDPAADAGRYLGTSLRTAFRAACAAFPHGAVPPAFRVPATVEAPALLLSGEADPVTPPSWARVAALHLPRARLLTLPGQGHGVLSRGCMPRLVAAFLEAGSADGLDVGCLERVTPAPFFVDLAGPRP
jgi:pimeloyl-ACP methyl ester carboxylesterase